MDALPSVITAEAAAARQRSAADNGGSRVSAEFIAADALSKLKLQ